MVKSMALLLEGKPFPRPKSGLLSDTGKWIVRGDTHTDKARFFWEGVPERRSAGKGNPGKLLCNMTRGLRFYGNGVCFWVFFWPIILPYLVWLRVPPGSIHISAKMDFRLKVLGRLEGHIMGWYLLLDPPKLFLVLVEALCGIEGFILKEFSFSSFLYCSIID